MRREIKNKINSKIYQNSDYNNTNIVRKILIKRIQ